MRSCRRLGVLRAVVIPSEPPDRSSRVRNDRPVTPQEGSMTARWCFGLASPLAVTVKPLLVRGPSSIALRSRARVLALLQLVSSYGATFPA